MANEFSRYPIVIDTPGAGDILTTPIRIKKIRWVNATTAGHQAVVQDQNGNIFWETIASGPNYVEESDFSTDMSNRVVINGLEVPTLSSGKLYIYQ
ncbi:MAG: hypothetical protein ACRCZI_10460 [Cetobacterium sp.]